MATRGGHPGCQECGGTSARVTLGDEPQRTLDSTSSRSLSPVSSSSSLSVSLSSSSSSTSTSPSWDNPVSKSDPSFSLLSGQVSVCPVITKPHGSPPLPARSASPRAERHGLAATLTPAPRIPAQHPRQAQPAALVTPCGGVGSLARLDGGARGGAAGGKEAGPVDSVGTMNTSLATAPNVFFTSSASTAPSATLSRAPVKASLSSPAATYAHALSSVRGTVQGPAPIGPCSFTCANNFVKLSKELQEAKDQLFALSIQMAEQSSHISKLMEENRRYIRENGKQKKKSASRAGATLLSPSNFDHFGSGVSAGSPRSVDGDYEQTEELLTELQDRVMALQIHNNELNVCLEREKRKRREAEARVERDEGYIKRLEDSVQTLRGTRVVMDSGAYRQLAEAYIASRRPPARRPHSHIHPGSDLVCDSTSDTALELPGMPLQTSSCPSSPKSDFSVPSSTSSSHSYPEDSQLFPAASRRNGSVRGQKERNAVERGGRPLGGSPMNPWDYQQLLENLEDLDGASRGALS